MPVVPADGLAPSDVWPSFSSLVIFTKHRQGSWNKTTMNDDKWYNCIEVLIVSQTKERFFCCCLCSVFVFFISTLSQHLAIIIIHYFVQVESAFRKTSYNTRLFYFQWRSDICERYFSDVMMWPDDVTNVCIRSINRLVQLPLDD